jgi:tetratricopeptide (TPR) repeat protein
MTAHPSSPQFVWVHLYDPHDPYEPPEPYSQTYKDRLYDGEIAYADSALANFVAYLKKIGRYDGGLVVVVGDHGEGLGEHREQTHGIFLYDSTTHVPLIVKLPGRAHPGKVADAQVRTTDILPTVLDLLNVPLPEHLDGESLRPCLDSAEAKDRTAVGETDYPLRFGWAPLRSVRAEGFKFIEAPRPELYDLRSDPGELANRYEADKQIVGKFRTLLAGLGDETQSQLPDPKDKIEEQNLLHAAMLASDDNRADDARAILEKALQLDPRSPTALRQLGELELKAGDNAKAAEHLKRAREVRPDDATAAFYEGEAREKTGDLAGARDALEASLKLTPGQFPARLLLGQVYFGLKDYKNAADQFEAALLLEPKSVAAQLDSARVQIAENNFAAAIEQLQPLSKSQPSTGEVFELLAQAYRGAGKQREAQQAEQRAKALQRARAPKY